MHDKKEYVIRIRNLKQILNHELLLRKVHRVVKFKEEVCLKPYINMETEQRKIPTNDFEKDLFKLMNNVVETL